MPWRILSIFIVLFWCVMTGLLIRVTYFPYGTSFVEVPPRLVLRLFLEQGSTVNTLHLYHRERKIGGAAVSARRLHNGGENDFVLMMAGSLDKGAIEGVEGMLGWRLNLPLLNGERWGGINGQIRFPDQGGVLEFDWQAGQPTPRFTLRQRGQITADEGLLQTQLQAMFGQQGLPPGMGAGSSADLISVQAREGAFKLAGQKRKGYLLTLGFMDKHQIKVFFTETGELALAELPNGYRALEPVVYGLIPEEPET